MHAHNSIYGIYINRVVSLFECPSHQPHERLSLCQLDLAKLHVFLPQFASAGGQRRADGSFDPFYQLQGLSSGFLGLAQCSEYLTQVCNFQRFLCLPIKLNLYLHDHVLGLGNYDNTLRRRLLWAAIPIPAVPVLPLLSFLLPILSSPFPQSSLAALLSLHWNTLLMFWAAGGEITVRWIHMCVTQMWDIGTGYQTGTAGPLQHETWSRHIETCLWSKHFQLKWSFFSSFLSDLQAALL